MNDSIRCPVCGRATWRVWEHTGPTWFSGAYGCGRCGCMKVDGMIHQDGSRNVLTVIPECLVHGFETVIGVGPGKWRCVQAGCHVEIERDGGRLMRSAWVDPVALAVV